MNTHRNNIEIALDRIESEICDIKNDAKKAFGMSVQLEFLLNEEEYDTDIALDLADDIKSLIDDIFINLEKLEKELY